MLFSGISSVLVSAASVLLLISDGHGEAHNHRKDEEGEQSDGEAMANKHHVGPQPIFHHHRKHLAQMFPSPFQETDGAVDQEDHENDRCCNQHGADDLHDVSDHLVLDLDVDPLLCLDLVEAHGVAQHNQSTDDEGRDDQPLAATAGRGMAIAPGHTPCNSTIGSDDSKEHDHVLHDLQGPAEIFSEQFH